MAVLRISIGMRNALADTVGTSFDTDGRIEIYTGSQPAAPADAPSGTLLATLSLASDAFGAASGGVVTAAAITGDSSADATGTAGWFRMFKNADGSGATASTTIRRVDGDVTASGGGGSLQFDSVSFVAGGAINVTSLTVTMPAS